jgi:hypothetical protein
MIGMNPLHLALVFMLCGCDFIGPSARISGTPTVRATDGAVASVTIIACPPNNSRSETAADLVTILLQSDELVTASSGASARLTINACPPHQFQPAAASSAASPAQMRR